ncbi:hypothetical protein FACS1894159_02830 [Bacteroidia bacterium]|nr:hypothetical protein FACS1894159_02830 [Bacteroidia bacterium]
MAPMITMTMLITVASTGLLMDVEDMLIVRGCFIVVFGAWSPFRFSPKQAGYLSVISFKAARKK